MTDIGEELRVYAEHWRANQPPVPEHSPALSARARRTRWAPVAAASVVALVVAGTACAASGGDHRATSAAEAPTPTVAPLAYDVPWKDLPAPPMTAVSVRPQPAADAPACTASQVTVQSMNRTQATQDDGVAIVFENVSARTCVLPGIPKVVAHGAGLSPFAAASSSMSINRVTWANMAPGQTSTLDVLNPRACAANAGGAETSARPYTSLVVSIRGGGSVTVPGVHLHAACGMTVDPFLTPLPPQPPRPDPLESLVASMTMPAAIHAGDVLVYVVTLSNLTDKAISIQPCPGYVQHGSIGVVLKQFNGLNCDTVRSIPAHGRVRYQMKLPIPAAASTGDLPLHWHLIGSDIDATGTTHVGDPRLPKP